MIARTTIEQLLRPAVNAPSGDNSQPWEFAFDGSTLSIYNLSERDATIFNYKQRGSYLSHGALVENIVLMASREGLSVDVRPFPGEAGLTAQLVFSDTGAVPDSLSDGIENRTTNRKPYEKRELERADTDTLMHAVSSVREASLSLVGDRSAVEQLAAVIGRTEKLLFSHRDLHKFLFSMIRWSPREEVETPGLYVMTMEFPAPLRFLLKNVFSKWSVLNMLNKIGLSSFISKQSTANHAASSAFGAIIIEGHSNTDYFNAGRALERAWLAATKAGLAIQPVTAMPYLLDRVRENAASMFSTQERELIQNSGEAIERAFSLSGGKHIAMLFRTGYDGQPSAHSAKLPPRFRS